MFLGLAITLCILGFLVIFLVMSNVGHYLNPAEANLPHFLTISDLLTSSTFGLNHAATSPNIA